VSRSQTTPSFCPPPFKNKSTGFGRHSRSEPVRFSSTPIVGLKSSLRHRWKISPKKKTVRLAVTEASVKKGCLLSHANGRRKAGTSGGFSRSDRRLKQGRENEVQKPRHFLLPSGVLPSIQLIFSLEKGVWCFIFSLSCLRQKLCVSLRERSHQSL
jgi:hypothetical protein